MTRARPDIGTGADAARPAGDELGAVVLSRLRKGGLRLLRPLGFMIVFLLLCEIALRLWLPPDGRVIRDPQNPYGCYREDDLSRLVLARQQAQALDVVLLGDSVLSAVNNRPGQRVEDYLQPLLRERLADLPGGAAVRVWNLGRGGSHAADLLAAAQQLRAAASPRGDLLLVLNSNIIFFSRRHESPAMLYPCLGEAFADDPAARALLRLPEGPRRLERQLMGLCARHVYLYQQRRAVAERLFGGPPREALRERAIEMLARAGLRPGPQRVETDDADLPWTGRGLRAESFATSYEILPLGSPRAVNFAMTRRLASWLGTSGLPAFVFLTPQNHGLLGALADGPTYHETGAAIAAAFTSAGVPFRSYDGALVDSLFLDLDHLTSAGNRRLAALLADDLTPRLRAMLGAMGSAPLPTPKGVAP